MKADYDVIILGGGLAGLTLAIQIKKQQPDITIAILEMRRKSATNAAHKVGESTVELGTYYLRETLDLKNYLEQKHLHKHGLRFFFSPHVKDCIERRVEHGAKNELFVPSHQIDRGIFENDLEKMVIELGVDFKLGTNVKDVDLNDEGHTVQYKQEGANNVLTSKWVVDATGRTNLLKRKENNQKETAHNVNAIWFRVEGDIDIADWSENSNWKDLINPGLRRLSTVHFMGKGYWVWFIPLSSGNTSIGIVADPQFHDFSAINTLEKAYNWLLANEPLCHKNLINKKDKVLDFKILKNYSYHSKLFYSTDNWGLVGEAGAFLDPFYSPGTDFIAMGNTWMTDLIIRELKGEDVYTRTVVYDKVHTRLFDNWLPIYQDKYELFDNAQVMSIKITWDFAVYWAIPSLLFTNNGLTDMNILKALFTTKNSFGERFGLLNKQVQDFYLAWGRIENEQFLDQYVDPMSVPYLIDFQKGLEKIHHSENDLITTLEKNLNLLEKIAAEVFRHVCAKLKGTPEEMSVDPYQMNLNFTAKKLIEHSCESTALPYDSNVKTALSKLWLNEKVAI